MAPAENLSLPLLLLLLLLLLVLLVLLLVVVGEGGGEGSLWQLGHSDVVSATVLRADLFDGGEGRVGAWVSKYLTGKDSLICLYLVSRMLLSVGERGGVCLRET